MRNYKQNHELLWQLTRREIYGRYQGSALGVLWAWIAPLLMLAVYTFVFGVVFTSRWAHAEGGGLTVALNIFCGLITFNIFGETCQRSATAITANPNYVKKVVFPLEVIPLTIVGAGLFHAALSYLILILVTASSPLAVHPTVILLPLVVVPVTFFALGAAWILSSLGVYLRDTAQIVPVGVSALLFMSPIFYPLSALPAKAQPVLELNPFTIMVEGSRALVFEGTIPDLHPLAIVWAFSIVWAYLGYCWFMKTKKGFADVI